MTDPRPKTAAPGEDSLRASEQLFTLLVESVREYSIFVISPDGLIATWNEGARRIKGYEAGEIIGQPYEVFFLPEDVAAGKPRRLLAQARREGSAHDEGWRRRKDGSRFWASATLTALYDDERRFRGFAKVTRDETAKHEASVELQRALERASEAEAKVRGHAAELEKRVDERTRLLTEQTEGLKRANAELEQFAYIASHDLKEPLRMISGYLDLLRVRYAGAFDERANGYFENVMKATRRMRELVESVLEYSRSDAGQETLEVVPVAEAIEQAVAAVGSALIENGAMLDVGPMPTVRANRTHLARVFQNLLGNAAKFRAAQPPRIAIRAEAREGWWEFSVADNGIGIEPRMQSRLFKIFQRLHAQDEYAGTGIGLATCKKIVERYGGTIRVESALGAGATFIFTLPKEE